MFNGYALNSDYMDDEMDDGRYITVEDATEAIREYQTSANDEKRYHILLDLFEDFINEVAEKDVPLDELAKIADVLKELFE